MRRARLIAVGAVAALVGLAGCATGAPPSTFPSRTATATPTASATPTPTPTKVAGMILGDGYRYKLPESWTESSKQPGADTMISTTDGAQIVVNVVPWSRDVGSLRDEQIRQLQSTVGGTAKNLDNRSIADTPAVGSMLTSAATSMTIYFALRGQKGYSIVLVTTEAKTPDMAKVLDSVLASWSWS